VPAQRGGGLAGGAHGLADDAPICAGADEEITSAQVSEPLLTKALSNAEVDPVREAGLCSGSLAPSAFQTLGVARRDDGDDLANVMAAEPTSYWSPLLRAAFDFACAMKSQSPIPSRNYGDCALKCTSQRQIKWHCHRIFRHQAPCPDFHIGGGRTPRAGHDRARSRRRRRTFARVRLPRCVTWCGKPGITTRTRRAMRHDDNQSVERRRG